MTINNNAEVKNQQNISGNATGYQQNISGNATGYQQINSENVTVDIREYREVEEIERIIEENCTEPVKEVILPVVSNLCNDINEGKPEAKSKSAWIGRICGALSTVANIATITSAEWWPALERGIDALMQRLP